MKNLYTNVPLKDAIDIALKNLYSLNEPQDLLGSTMKRFFYMSVQRHLVGTEGRTGHGCIPGGHSGKPLVEKL